MGRRSPLNLQPSTFNRGTTLTEVLMSIMILSIGIISLATLFPISVIRALQATQLTNATHLRFNAETTIDTLNGQETTPTLVNIVHNPDGDDLGDDPNAFTEHYGTNYIVDPLGVFRADAALKNSFGHDGLTPPMPHADALPRFVGNTVWSNGASDEAETLQAVSLPDSWIDVIDGAVSETYPPALATSITLPPEFVLAGLTFGPAVSHRIILFDVTGRKSHTRIINGTTPPGTNWVVNWAATEPIPTPFTVASVRIQTQEARYTWLLTVRKAASGPANVDVVVFFRRPGPPEEERVLNVNFAEGLATVNITALDPGMKRGGYILDLQNARWYRILDTSPTALTIDRPALENSTAAVVMPSVIEVYPIKTKIHP